VNMSTSNTPSIRIYNNTKVAIREIISDYKNSSIKKVTKKKLTMKSKFKRWIRNWINQEEAQLTTIGRVEENPELNTEGPMRITIHKAAGGLIVETRTYDNLKDRSHQRLHIVTHDQDLAQSLTKIITMESLRG